MPPPNGSMRIQRLIVLLAIGVLACLSLLLLRSSKHSEPQPIDLPPPEPIQHPQLHAGQNTYLPEKEHPITRLVGNAQQDFNHAQSRQSKTLAEAVTEYKRRYNMHPPPFFDKWFEFAQSRNVQLIDDFDTIYHTLLPFWGVKPRTIRERARETLGFDNAMIGVLIRDGKVSLTDGGGDAGKWQRDATAGMMKSFVKYLPDMDLVFNTHDEPRVILPSEDLQRLVQTAKDFTIPAAFKNTPTNAWSPRASDLNKGDRIDEVRTTRFNRFAHQPTWTNSRVSCPVNSPARSLEENPTDDVDPYAYGELGFIYNTTAASDICNTPSLRHTYGFFDRPNAFDVVHDLFPVFSQSKISSFQDIIYPSPWYWADKVPYDTEKDYAWEAKTDRMYWRGSTTGGFSRAGGWRRQHRQQFVDNVNALGTTQILARQGDSWVSQVINRDAYRDSFDVKFTFIGQCDPDDCNAQTAYFGVFKQAGQQDAWAHKFLVDIDGNAFSGRFHAFLHSNSFVYKIAIFREWHDEWLKPWVHYVPLSLKGNEYVESMRYFTSEEEGKKAALQIANQGQRWAQQTLRNEDLEVWFFRLLLEYGRLVDDNREQLGFVL
ncbi:Lipopolysaccharide-modifying protein [Penicillium roqueforti FM164]|uniref:Lipopolysaccharide-modifying protein n=2 Tax=Penicillium roqueforti TaxID=5082 RepID=W6QAV7_PENRF|nr:Lipopolysaccharide-modifying protein [Penicillium roqueforti FM164]